MAYSSVVGLFRYGLLGFTIAPHRVSFNTATKAKKKTKGETIPAWGALI
jgi:hypothetical protein